MHESSGWATFGSATGVRAHARKYAFFEDSEIGVMPLSKFEM
jgi:hypothetical protein